MTFQKFQCRLPSKEKRWELTRYNFCTPLSHTKRCAKAFIHRKPGEKVAFFMSRRHARYKSEEIAPGGDPPPVRSWSDGRLELQTSLEKLSETSQITRIIQNSFHGM